MGQFFGVFLFALGMSWVSSLAQAGGCFKSPQKAVGQFGEQVYACELATTDMQFCGKKRSGCYKLDFRSAENNFRGKLKSQGGYAARKILRFLQRSSLKEKGTLLSYLDLMKWQKPIRLKAHLKVQTGPYGKIHLTDQPTQAKCLKEVLQAAYLLETHFPKITFQIDGTIQSCKNLRDGVDKLVANKPRVKKNIGTFITPMHTIFLTTRTKFNHYVLGKMGLYINVDRSKEIKKRLVELRVSRSEIPHETRRL